MRTHPITDKNHAEHIADGGEIAEYVRRDRTVGENLHAFAINLANDAGEYYINGHTSAAIVLELARRSKDAERTIGGQASTILELRSQLDSQEAPDES